MEVFSETAKIKILVFLMCIFSLFMPFSTAFADVVITEMMYHAESDLDEDDFLELYNTDSVAVNLENWQMNGLSFTFGPNSSIGPNAYLVLAKEANRFQATYGFPPDYVFDGNLQNSGETIQVIDDADNVIDEVEAMVRVLGKGEAAA